LKENPTVRLVGIVLARRRIDINIGTVEKAVIAQQKNVD
jgi:hypothetical protein